VNRLYAEFRAAVRGDRLEGHAAVFGQAAQIRGGYEAIGSGAFDEVLARGDDVVGLRDHNPTMLLGRTASGTLRLGVDGDGLAFEVPKLPNTTYANDLRELVERGDLRGASFGFLPGRDELGHAPDGRQLRTHTSISRLLDVSVVTLPAYDGTDVALRHLTFDPPTLDRRTQIIRARYRALSRRYSL
jgi:HK97 family phage prohead protease